MTEEAQVPESTRCLECDGQLDADGYCTDVNCTLSKDYIDNDDIEVDDEDEDEDEG